MDAEEAGSSDQPLIRKRRRAWQENNPVQPTTSTSGPPAWTVASECVKDNDQQDADEQDDEAMHRSRSTVTRGLLSTSGFVWVPLCRPSEHQSVCIPNEVQSCPRFMMRRNALCDPMQMTLPQDTRERIQKEVEDRKTSFTRKVSQYFKAIYSTDYEVDLV